MLTDFVARLQSEVVARVEERYGVKLGHVAVQYPPSIELGDLAMPIAFGIGKQLRRNPKEIAAELAAAGLDVPGIVGVSASGGFLNLKLDRSWALMQLANELNAPPAQPAAGGKVIVEHTNINPNKAAHIGHLRNAVLGDSLVRLLRYLGEPVEVQNYIDDTGVQVADVVLALIRQGRLGDERLEELIADGGERFDHYCWDRYAEVGALYEKEPELKTERSRILHALEHGEEPLSGLASRLAMAIVRCHMATMDRIGVRYDLLPRERDILRHEFWSRALAMLKTTGAVFLAAEGKMKGCWVLHLAEDEKGHQDPDKILVRSDGTTTYVGKDIAYQMWKFGLLGEDFGYEPFHTYPDGHVVWSTLPTGERNGAPPFGAATTVYNVIDTRQSYLQRVVKEGLRAQGHSHQAERSIHFSYEMVALSPRCAQELGLELSDEDRQKPYVEMSGRRGLGVKADDLLDRLYAGAVAKVTEANADFSAERVAVLATKVARAALRYSMLKPGRNKVIAFDFDEALAFEGDTGPYVLYAAVRARSIFARLEAEKGLDRQWVEELFDRDDLLADLEPAEQDAIWRLIGLALRLPQVAAAAAASLELGGVARYAFQLAQEWSTFYHSYHILREEDERRVRARAACAWLVMGRLVQTLDLLGIDVPERM